MTLDEFVSNIKKCVVCNRDLIKAVPEFDTSNMYRGSYTACSGKLENGSNLVHLFAYDDGTELTISMNYSRSLSNESDESNDIFFSFSDDNIYMWFSAQYHHDGFRLKISHDEFKRYMTDYDFVSDKINKINLLK